ncbi:MAG: type II toxin-antitoxin system VapC family toxin [Verrucomicrobiales bacterium]
MNEMFFDTCFLIDLGRERRAGPGRAHAFLEVHAGARPWISWVVAGEFAEGFDDIHHPACAGLLANFDVVAMDESTAHHYAQVTRHLRRHNQLISTNDLWIASTCLAHGLPLVSGNGSHFGRVPGLTVISY